MAFHRGQLSRAGVTAVVVVVALAACRPFIYGGSPANAPLLVPDTVEIIARPEERMPDSNRYHFTDGDEMDVPRDTRLLLGDRVVEERDLFIAGSEPEPWVLIIEYVDEDHWASGFGRMPPGCRMVAGQARLDDEFLYQTVRPVARKDPVEVRFPRAPDFTYTASVGDSDQLYGEYTCLNGRGEAIDHF